MKKYLLFFAVFTILFSACKKSDSTTPTFDPAVQAKVDDDKIQAYLKANPSIIATKDPSGLYYQILTPGTGTVPTVNSTVTQVSSPQKILRVCIIKFLRLEPVQCQLLILR